MCSSDSKRHVPKYHLVQKFHRSKHSVAARANFISLTSCRRLGIEKKALALNFSPLYKSLEEDEFTCEVLKCPEVRGATSLTNDSRYDYYSIYAKPIADANATCVPATGMFYFLQLQLNSSQSQLSCSNKGGVLADVSSEHRTDALSQLLIGAGVPSAFVGMQRSDQKFYATNGDPLDCTSYRAWSPGHPRRNSSYSCVVLTHQHTWRSVACEDTLPSLCEIMPGGPYEPGSLYSKKGHSNGCVVSV
ncbi:uncharacterized protein LOC126980067 [Leptidea sinapis]|uniref:uncharacterized protein LOC126980067 n=1 Tax=Leptidea sinapis TaxID=189913 RepID=UPI0021C49CB5|nr:uncharacterized protein LOC126980067 [Leptidea sinapis]